MTSSWFGSFNTSSCEDWKPLRRKSGLLTLLNDQHKKSISSENGTVQWHTGNPLVSRASVLWAESERFICCVPHPSLPGNRAFQPVPLPDGWPKSALS